MKVACKVIEDLLPLYRDQVCSRESRDMVDEHLKDCQSCATLLSEIDSSITCPKTDGEETKCVNILKAAWDKGRRKSFLKGAAVAVLICAVMAGGFLGLTQWKCIPVSAELLEVSDVCRLSDGKLAYHLKVNDDKELHLIKFTVNGDGSFYLTPMRSVIEGKAETDFGLQNGYGFIDIKERERDSGMEITSCYLGPESGGILIWEKGMDIPEASAELEAQILENY